MHQLLTFIVTYMGFLWTDARYRITDSTVGTSNGGDALLIVESAVIRLQFLKDRGQLFLDLQPVDGAGKHEWYSIDLICRLFGGTCEPSGLLDQSYAEFFQENVDSIELRFSADKLAETRAELKVLERRRSKEMFG